MIIKYLTNCFTGGKERFYILNIKQWAVNPTKNCCHGAAALQGPRGQHSYSRDYCELSCWVSSVLRVCDQEVHRVSVSSDLPGWSLDDLCLVLLWRHQRWSLNTTRQWSGIREGLRYIFFKLHNLNSFWTNVNIPLYDFSRAEMLSSPIIVLPVLLPGHKWEGRHSPGHCAQRGQCGRAPALPPGRSGHSHRPDKNRSPLNRLFWDF